MQKLDTHIADALLSAESIKDSLTDTLSYELNKAKSSITSDGFSIGENKMNRGISAIIAIALVIMIFLAGPATAFAVQDWSINDGEDFAIYTGTYVTIDATISKDVFDGYSDYNVYLNLTNGTFNQNFDGNCDWTAADYNNAFGYGYGYGTSTPLTCVFTAGPLTTSGAYTGTIYVNGSPYLVSGFDLSVLGDTATPITADTNLSSVFDFNSDTNGYTAGSNLSITTSDTQQPISALIPSGTEITTSDGSAVDLNSLTVTDSSESTTGDLGISSNGSIFETVQFGIPGVTLYFSSPVQVRIPVSVADGTSLEVLRKGSTGGWTTEGLTDSTGTCASGVGTPANSTYTASNGYITVYTCKASDFTAYKQGVVTGSGRTVRPIVATVVEPVEETPTQETTPTQEEPVVTEQEETNLPVENTNTQQETSTSPIGGLLSLFNNIPAYAPLGLIALVLIGLVVLVLKGKTVTKKRK